MRARYLRNTQTTLHFPRLFWVKLLFVIGFIVIFSRLAYWQVLKHDELTQVAAEQYQSNQTLDSARGTIFDSQGRVMAGNEERYTLFAEPQNISQPVPQVVELLMPVLKETLQPTSQQATDEAWWRSSEAELKAHVTSQLANTGRRWVPLAHRLSRAQKERIEALELRGLGFDAHEYRSYPDASVSAHLLGFVGKDSQGRDQGYFGLEGFYNLELQGREGIKREQKTARGLPIAFGKSQEVTRQSGRNIYLTVDKVLQYQVEQELKAGVERYGAKAGEVVIMEPKTGAILAMASYPNYNPQRFLEYDPQLYRNPAVSDLYEPGSTFKVLTVAAALQDKKITPDTICPNCAGPRSISGFQIKTWNGVYNPNVSMRDALAKSDNVAMVFVQESLGKERFLEWLRQFGLGEKTGVDLQGEAQFEFREDAQWRTIDVATASFGQGIATTSLNLTRAVASIANGGLLLQPSVVQAVEEDGERIVVQPQVLRRVLSEETTKTVTEMMVYSAQQGDSKWTTSRDVNVAGKTGTAQISENGRYLEDKTIASFIGFAPAENPQFVMLVKLREPSTSPWGSETAAPLWYRIMRHIL